MDRPDENRDSGGTPRVLFVADDCSSVPFEYRMLAQTWLNRMLAAGNPEHRENFFRVGSVDDDGS